MNFLKRMFCVALICGAIFAAASGQNKAELCRGMQEQIDAGQKQVDTLKIELSYTKTAENTARDGLSIYNKALADPQQRAVLLRGEAFNSPRGRQLALERYGLPWNDSYLDNDTLFLRTIRDAQVKVVQRVTYVLTYKGEIQQQKADAERQLANLRGRLADFGCTGNTNSVDLAGIWQATVQASDCTLIYTLNLQPSGFKTWSGPLTTGGNCPNQADNGFIGNVTLMFKTGERLNGIFSGHPFEAQYKNSQITFGVLFGGDMPFVRK